MQINKLLYEIRKANAMFIDDILGTAMDRKRELYPDWELFYCASEKGKMNGVEDMLQAAWEFEQRLRAKK